jgi:hypothetical protein
MNTVPEVWTVVVDRGSVATLTVPPHLNRQRVFDVDAVLLARIPAEGRPASFSLSVEVDGALQWTRTVPGQTPGEVDTLEYHCRVSVDATRQLRLRARSALSECSLQQLRLTAVEASD